MAADFGGSTLEFDVLNLSAKIIQATKERE